MTMCNCSKTKILNYCYCKTHWCDIFLWPIACNDHIMQLRSRCLAAEGQDNEEVLNYLWNRSRSWHKNKNSPKIELATLYRQIHSKINIRETDLATLNNKMASIYVRQRCTRDF